MKNPLTLEERNTVPRLIGHDLAKQVYTLSQITDKEVKKNPDIKNHITEHIMSFFSSITILTQYDERCSLFKRNKNDIKSKLRIISAVSDKNKTKISYAVQLDDKLWFNTRIGLVYSVLYNLTKNSISHGLDWGEKKNGRVHLSASEFKFSKDISNLVFISDEKGLDGHFIRFNVNDNGVGFPKDKPLSDYLKLGMTGSKSGIGFGLYYVTLVCKFLRSHMSIDSKKGDTNVSIYHPLNLK
ncbi:hypothetical protein AYK26_01530 [Euryarchaeota archaeon SM23-78]|nr:MAG: hypothetical protein AYK26_01530 [Euryarchaeota archaeon SM23-78]MBW3000452.1 hypothetical protein [Candidatus Woesearchaeota archaeon]